MSREAFRQLPRVLGDRPRIAITQAPMPVGRVARKPHVYDRIAQIAIHQSVAFGADKGSTGSTQIPQDDTIPQSGEGDKYLSVSITPKNSGSTLIIEVLISVSRSTSGEFVVALFQNGTASAINSGSFDTPAGTVVVGAVLTHTMTAGVTTALTFDVNVGPVGAATISVNGQSGARIHGGVLSSCIKVTEYTPS